MTIESDCYTAAIGAGVDPSGTPWAELDPALLHTKRSSIKWARYPADVLPMFVAEMDFAVAPEIRAALHRAVEASDIGYVDSPAPYAEAFADFVEDRWAWRLPHQYVRLTTDVATGVVEALRLAPKGQRGRLVLSTPCYPGFFEMLQELPFEVVEVPLSIGRDAGAHPGKHSLPAVEHTQPVAERVEVPGTPAGLDLAAIEREFEAGTTAFILCNPHNPHGVPFGADELTALAKLAAAHDVFVVSDEIHAPLTHHGATFTPFAPIAAEAGALSVTVTSASKGFNLAGAKCAAIVAADDRAHRLLDSLPPEVLTRTSILGVHAGIAAFTEARDWLDRAITQIQTNQRLFEALVAERLPGISYSPGSAGYLAWLDLRSAGLGEAPAARLLGEARIGLNDGAHFGSGGQGFARLNLACAPGTIVQGVERIASLAAPAATQAGGLA